MKQDTSASELDPPSVRILLATDLES